MRNHNLTLVGQECQEGQPTGAQLRRYIDCRNAKRKLFAQTDPFSGWFSTFFTLCPLAQCMGWVLASSSARGAKSRWKHSIKPPPTCKIFLRSFLKLGAHPCILRWLGTVLGRTKCANFFVKTYCLWHKRLENEIILRGHRAPIFRKWVWT